MRYLCVIVGKLFKVSDATGCIVVDEVAVVHQGGHNHSWILNIGEVILELDRR